MRGAAGFALPLAGGRVVVDRLVEADAPALSVSHSDAANARFQGWKSPLSVEQARQFITGEAGGPWVGAGDAVQLAIREVAGGPLVGDLWVDWSGDDAGVVEVGITLTPGAHGRGLATAVVQALVTATLGDPVSGVGCLRAWADTENLPSIALFERCGFTRLGEPEASARRDGSPGVEVRLERRA